MHVLVCKLPCVYTASVAQSPCMIERALLSPTIEHQICQQQMKYDKYSHYVAPKSIHRPSILVLEPHHGCVFVEGIGCVTPIFLGSVSILVVKTQCVHVHCPTEQHDRKIRNTHAICPSQPHVDGVDGSRVLQDTQLMHVWVGAFV